MEDVRSRFIYADESVEAESEAILVSEIEALPHDVRGGEVYFGEECRALVRRRRRQARKRRH